MFQHFVIPGRVWSTPLWLVPSPGGKHSFRTDRENERQKGWGRNEGFQFLHIAFAVTLRWSVCAPPPLGARRVLGFNGLRRFFGPETFLLWSSFPSFMGFSGLSGTRSTTHHAQLCVNKALGPSPDPADASGTARFVTVWKRCTQTFALFSLLVQELFFLFSVSS